MRYNIPIIIVATTVLVGCHSLSRVHSQPAAATVAARPPTRPMLITTPGTHPTADGAWRVEVSESLLAISRSNTARGEGWTGWSTVSPAAWRAQAGWFVFVENESRVWAYDGDRKLLLQTETFSGNHSTGTTYSSAFPCAVPAEVFSRLSEPAQKAIQTNK